MVRSCQWKVRNEQRTHDISKGSSNTALAATRFWLRWDNPPHTILTLRIVPLIEVAFIVPCVQILQTNLDASANDDSSNQGCLCRM